MHGKDVYNWLTNCDYQTWIFGKYFLKNEKSEYFISKEAIVDIDKKKNESFQVKIRVLENYPPP